VDYLHNIDKVIMSELIGGDRLVGNAAAQRFAKNVN
jgi:hypothetical protein